MLHLKYKLLFFIFVGSILSCSRGNEGSSSIPPIDNNSTSMRSLNSGFFDFRIFANEKLEGRYNFKHQIIIVEHTGGNPDMYNNRGESVRLLNKCKTSHFLGFDKSQEYAFFTYSNSSPAAAIPVANLVNGDCTPSDTLGGRLFFSADRVVESQGEKANYFEFLNGRFSKVLTLEQCHNPLQGCKKTDPSLVNSFWYFLGDNIFSIEIRSETFSSPFKYVLKYWTVVNGKILKSNYKVFYKDYEKQTQYDSGNLGGKQKANALWIRNFLYLSLHSCLESQTDKNHDVMKCIDTIYQSEVPLHKARANGGEIWKVTTRYLLYDTLDGQFHLWDLRAREEVKNDQLVAEILSALNSYSPEAIPRIFQVLSENQFFVPRAGKMFTIDVKNQNNPLEVKLLEIKYIDQAASVGFVQDSENTLPYMYKAVPLKF